MPSSQPRFEEVAGQRLPLGGVNGYLGVRGKQGRGKDKFQGVKAVLRGSSTALAAAGRRRIRTDHG